MFFARFIAEMRRFSAIFKKVSKKFNTAEESTVFKVILSVLRILCAEFLDTISAIKQRGFHANTCNKRVSISLPLLPDHKYHRERSGLWIKTTSFRKSE